MNSYELSRSWFDFCFENPEKIKPNHTALYFFAIEHCNRLGWKKKFGFPTTMAMEAIGIKSYNTYINTMNDLVAWGAFEMIEKSTNQYSANIIALSNINKPLVKALDKAFIKHVTKQGTKQGESTSESIDSIDKPLTINNEPITKEQGIVFPFDSDTFLTQWNIWKEYRKGEDKFNYKTNISEQAALAKLSKLANQKEDQAIEIINQSISNGWKGFFANKEKEKETKLTFDTNR